MAIIIAVAGSLLLVNTIKIYYKMYQREYSFWIFTQQNFAKTKKKLLGEKDKKSYTIDPTSAFDYISQ